MKTDTEAPLEWTARNLSPVVLLYVAAIFFGMMALCHLVFHSMTAVKALAMTAVAAIVPLVPSVLAKTDYRIIGREIERRRHRVDPPKDFKPVVSLEDLAHIVPMRNGFKFYKPLEEPNPIRRFWKTHVSDEYSGEIHVERVDRDRVFEMLTRAGIPQR